MSGIVADNLNRTSGVVTTSAAGPTISSSDPTTSTNAELGTQWANSTSGEFYVLTDSTADANVWTNVGDGEGDIELYNYGGATSGYRAAGYPATNVIDKFSFTSDGNATDIGNLTETTHAPGGNNSKVSGYRSGGHPTNVVDKWSFTSDGDATDVGDLTVARSYPSQPGGSSLVHGYTLGGYGPPLYDVVDKFTFAADANATDVGNLTTSHNSLYGHNSETHCYAAKNTIIEKVAFASDGNATDVGALSTGSATSGAGQSSQTHGYSSGAEPSGGDHGNVIDKYAFASEGTAGDVGDLTVGHSNTCGQSSRTYGYCTGGDGINVIEKFPFASDTNATDVGDITQSIGYMSGQHY